MVRDPFSFVKCDAWLLFSGRERALAAKLCYYMTNSM